MKSDKRLAASRHRFQLYVLFPISEKLASRQLRSRSDPVFENKQHMSLRNKKCKKMLGQSTPPDAFGKYLTWSASFCVCHYLANPEITLYMQSISG